MDTDNPQNSSIVDAIMFKAAKTANLEALLESPLQLIAQNNFVVRQMTGKLNDGKWLGNDLINLEILTKITTIVIQVNSNRLL